MNYVSDDELYIVRKQVVRMRMNGCSTREVAKNVGVTEDRVLRIWRGYRRTGEIERPKKAGRKPESCKLLNAEQEQEIRKILIDKTPEQFKLNFMLWTRAAVCGLVKRKYGIELSLRVMTNYLRGWGMTCQRPTKQAYFQDNVKVERFKKEAYPAIKARCEAEGGEIYWGDETGVDNQEHYQRGYSLKGRPPVMKVEAKREAVSMVSAINNYGAARFSFYDGAMNQQLFIEFMERLITDAHRKVFFIVDNLKSHHGKIVAAWLAEHKSQIELFFIPPYSPELNPDEYLNHALKLDVHGGVPPRTRDGIRAKSSAFMDGLTAQPERIKAFFKHKNLAYQFQ